MTDLSADAARTLELLRDADGPLSYEELSDAGVRRPGDAVYELQLVGKPIDTAHGRVRLGHSRPRGFVAAQGG
jgi:hypothetical protein